MRYSKDEQLEIGREIYYGEITRYEAASTYGINFYTARDYMRLYRDANNLPHKNSHLEIPKDLQQSEKNAEIKRLEAMTKKELIRELLRLKANEL